MVKVCHMTSAHSAEDVRIFHKECVSLKNDNYDVFLVQRGSSYEKSGVHIVGAGKLSDSRINRVFCASRLVYKLARQVDADIYHFHDPELLPYGIKLKRLGKIVIFDSHEDYLQLFLERDYIPKFLRKPLQYIFKNYIIRTVKKFDAVVTVTPHIEEFYRQYNPQTVGVANYPIVNIVPDHPLVQDMKLFFAGGVTKQWNHEAIIRAIDRIPNCTYELCGPISDDYLDELSQLPGWEKVKYLGIIPFSEVQTRMLTASIGLALLSPSRNSDYQNGTMGNTKVFEEMAAGLPVICTDFILWKKFIDKYNCGVTVNPSNSEQIYEAILKLSKDLGTAHLMGKNGQCAILEEFNWGCEEKKLLQLYHSLSSQIGG